MITVREMSGKCQGILTKPIAMNPDDDTVESLLLLSLHKRNQQIRHRSPRADPTHRYFCFPCQQLTANQYEFTAHNVDCSRSLKRYAAE